MGRQRHSWSLLCRASIPTHGRLQMQYMANLYACQSCALFKAVGRMPGDKQLTTRYRVTGENGMCKEFVRAPSCPAKPLI
jgi:hypothetical protein